MYNGENLLISWDYLLLFIYFILFSILLKKVIFRKASKSEKKLLLLFLATKIIYTALHAFMIANVWKMADSVFVYEEAKNISSLIQKDFSNIQIIFKSALYYRDITAADSGIKILPGSDMETNFSLVRAATLFYPVALGRYLLISFGFCCISTIGVFKMYQTLTKIYPAPAYKKIMALCLLFVPTITFYTTPIYKETLVFAFMGFAASSIYSIYNKRNIVSNSIFAAVNIFFILLVKPYTIYACSIALVLSLLISYISKLFRDSILNKALSVLIVAASVFASVYFIDLFDSYIISFVDTSNFYQQVYNDGEGNSSFEIGELETSLSGLIKKTPTAIYTTYFRPHLWEAKNAFVFFNAVESVLVLILFVFTLVKRGIHIYSFLRENLFHKIIFFYCLVMGILIGLTTFNFGTLVRYKATVLPFFCIFCFLVLFNRPPKKAQC